MGEPWLDSLSEDWNSEPHLSSLALSLTDSKHGTQNLRDSQSRIPHLAHSMRQNSTSNNYLKPRSTRGIAKSQGMPILSERSASSLNATGNQPRNPSGKRRPSSAIPRRTSSNFSDSQQSVQHYTVDVQAKSTPEWKKRIQNGEDVASDGFDLFSPSKLEGMFAHPTSSTPNKENYIPLSTKEQKPWTALNVSKLPATADSHHSFRTSRSRVPPMESLPELNEEENNEHSEDSLCATSSDLVQDGSMRGLVRRRVGNLERTDSRLDQPGNDSHVASIAPKDPRWRTVSGQQELRNEEISPVTASTKNTISAKAVRDSVELNPELLRKRLLETGADYDHRPASRSSDRDVSYTGAGIDKDSFLHETLLLDMTSHSLPEDLSMGTQDFIPQRGLARPRRTSYSDEQPSINQRLSSAKQAVASRPLTAKAQSFRSSPPPYDIVMSTRNPDVDDGPTFLSDVQDESVVHHVTDHQRPNSAGSPLKLFGNRDTYTNNKLLRVLSQYEQDKSSNSNISDELVDGAGEQPQPENDLRMSQFGNGELNTFNFAQEITRSVPPAQIAETEGDKIFLNFADLTIDDGDTFADKKFVANNVLEHNVEESKAKRDPSSPAKDRTPKRRRTLLKDEIVVDGVGIEVKLDRIQSQSSLAGQKRKDAKPGEGGSIANAEVLASRSILRPRSGSRKSSHHEERNSLTTVSKSGHDHASDDITEALAVELASFAQGVSEGQRDSRKPSLATKDYMEEANKVMEFIRARGKPKSQLSEIQEPDGTSEIDADRILDLQLDEESTVEPFSRPPSRDGPPKPRRERRLIKHDPQTANHLQKFKDSDELDLLASTSVMGTLQLVDDYAGIQIGVAPLNVKKPPLELQDMEVIGGQALDRKRRHSGVTSNDETNTVKSNGSSSHPTFTTEASCASGQRGMITSGKVEIPDNVGTMSFDHEKQIWVKQQLKKHGQKQSQSGRSSSIDHDEATADDPFDDIPDLSVDEQHEAAMKIIPRSTSRPSTSESIHLIRPQPGNAPNPSIRLLQNDRANRQETHEIQFQHDNRSDVYIPESSSPESQDQGSLRSEASKHEERLHQGLPSRMPALPGTPNRQPRVVTIAFSSPVASDIPQPVTVDITTPVSDDEDFLPPDDSGDDDEIEYLRTPHPPVSVKSISTSDDRQSEYDVKHQLYRSMTSKRRPVSRIEERDENEELNDGLSLVCLREQSVTTPARTTRPDGTKPVSVYKGTSILCLTPLSEFTMHQADKANHPEESFVQERAHPKALLQAHGALALSLDVLIQAITDATPDEPFWEQMRKLDLTGSRLQSVHGLQNYCAELESLHVSNNEIVQLDGLPSSLRHLDISHNKVNDFTSWAHLQNLQYLDVSNNHLETVEGFSSLLHVRKLRCAGNSIRDIDGILDLDGLLSLDLQQNALKEIDFEGSDLGRLEELNISTNNLTAVRNLQGLPRLKTLDISNNKLEQLVVAEPMTNLTTLRLGGNKLESLDLRLFPKLKQLDLDHNRIHVLQGLSTALQLERLSLREQCSSPGIVDFILSTPNECREILLASNMVTDGRLQMPRYPQYNVRVLDLAACGIRMLPPGFGDFFPNCRLLNLNFNALGELSPLVGSIKLRKLCVASNRIKRLRRTCLTLSRIPGLKAVDLRDNPLTIGFYAPEHREQVKCERYEMPARSKEVDHRWLQLLDETTSLKRKMVELLLSQGCHELEELDGLQFAREACVAQGATWDNLLSKGIILKAMEPSTEKVVPISVIEMPADSM